MEQQTQGHRIRLLLMASQALFRSSLARFLALEPGLELVGESSNAAEALEVLAVSGLDVVLLDCDDGMQARDRFLLDARDSGYGGYFLLLTSSVDLGNTAAAIRLGASGIFLKSDAPDRLVQAINLVSQGSVWLDQSIVRQLADHSVDRFELDDRESGELLTDREQKVLQGILRGLTNKKIGEDLGLSEGSVKTSVQQLFHRAGVRTRCQLVRAALEGSFGSRSPAERLTV